MLDTSTPEPYREGPRENVHRRHALGQTLHFTDGIGLVQTRDGNVIRMRSGERNPIALNGATHSSSKSISVEPVLIAPICGCAAFRGAVAADVLPFELTGRVCIGID
jgi:hypothetical protein